MMPIICFCVENTMVYTIAEVAASDSYQSGQWWEFLSWPRFLNVLETRDQFLLVAKSIIGRKLSIQVSFLSVVICVWWLVPANLQSFMWHCNNCAASISDSYTMSPIDHAHSCHRRQETEEMKSTHSNHKQYLGLNHIMISLDFIVNLKWNIRLDNCYVSCTEVFLVSRCGT